jgi:uncharacterized protein (DUF362 family)
MAKNTWTRRKFIASTGSAGASILLGAALIDCAGDPSNARSGTGTGGASGTNPNVGTGGGNGDAGPGGPGTMPAAGTVVHVHDSAATSWDFGSSWFGDHVAQNQVDAMFEHALLALTGAGSMAAAWKVLIPAYAAGKKFAIKVNFNNYTSGTDANIDAIIEPVNAVIRSLVALGAAPADIVVYDCTNGMHVGGMPQATFISRCAYSGVRFAYTSQDTSPYANTYSTETVTFRNTSVAARPLAKALVDSDYLINMPIVKAHSGQIVTLGFKHHFGSINGCNNLHGTTNPGNNPNSLVDLFMSKHISGKTVLTVGDCLFGNWKSVSGKPPAWKLFSNGAANSLIVSADPVAADSVMCDLLDAEMRQNSTNVGQAREYMTQAATQNLGVFDQATDVSKIPLSGYTKIHYTYLESTV